MKSEKIVYTLLSETDGYGGHWTLDTLIYYAFIVINLTLKSVMTLMSLREAKLQAKRFKPVKQRPEHHHSHLHINRALQ